MFSICKSGVRIAGLHTVLALLVLSCPAHADELAARVEVATSLSIQASRLAPQAAAAEIGRDPAALLHWVQRGFDVEGYEGLRRGTRGVMFSGSGNPAELSMLLGEMLDAHGIQWRIATADLDSSEAAAVFSLLADRASFHVGGGPAMPPTYNAATDSRRAQAVRTHVWVQARIDGEWVDLDPTLPLEAGARLKAPDQIASPDDFRRSDTRSVTIQLQYRTTGTDGGVLLTRRMSMEEVSYRNVAISLQRDIATGRFTPTLRIGDLEESGVAFASRGLQELRLEVILGEGRQARTLRSILLMSDAPGGATLDDHHVQISLLLLSGWVTRPWVEGVLSTLVGEMAAALESTARSEGESAVIDSDAERTFAELAPGITGLLALAHASRSDLMTRTIARTMGVRAWWNEPRIIVSTLRRTGSHATVDIDLVANTPDAVPATGMPEIATGAFHVLRGAAELELQRSLLDAVVPEGTRLGAEPLRSRTWHSASNPQAAVFSSELLPPILRNHLRDILSRHNRVIAVPADSDLASFAWIIDGASGHIGPMNGSLVRSAGSHRTSTSGGESFNAAAQRYRSLVSGVIGLLLEHPSDSGIPLGSELCAAQCAVNELAPRVCREDEDRPTLNVATCLAAAAEAEGTARGPVGSLRVGRGGCFRTARPAICGGLIANLTMSGRLEVSVDERSPLAPLWAEVQATPLEQRCTCN